MLKNALRYTCIFVALIVLLIAPVSNANAQGRSAIRSGSYEVGPFLGASYGIDEFRFMGGGNVTFAINKRILPYAEYSYFPGIGRTQSGTDAVLGPYKLHYSIPISDFHGGVHIRFPIHEKPVVPYLVFGMGGLTHVDRQVTATFSAVSGSITQQQARVPGGTDFAVNLGGGMRFYLGQRYGFRVEAKAYKPTGAFPDVFGKVEGGFFFQLR